jgi:hypothetical protein
MEDFVQRLRERVAQQAPLRYTTDQLNRMREQAIEREPHYRQRLAEMNDRLRQNRFRKRSQHTIFCGYTDGYSKEGPFQLVVIETDKHNNKCFRRRAVSGKLERVDVRHFSFKSGFDEDLARTVAGQRYNQARALESLELSGGMSKSEAVMAARHPNAWKAALAVAKDKGIYVGDEAEPTLQEDIDAQAAGLQIFEEYKRVYARADLQPEAVSHALSFYWACHLDFPDDWSENDHLDFFVFRYAEVMTHHEGVLAGSIEGINYNCDEHIDAIVRIANDVMRSPRLADFQQHIINHRNHHQIEYLSFIARVDALPHVYLRDDHHNPDAFLESSRTYDNLIDAENPYQDSITQPSWTPPTDFTHWDIWIRIFYPDLTVVSHIPYYSPRITVVNSPYDPEEPLETQAIKIKLRQIERLFAKWRNDVVDFFALDKIRLAAADGKYEEMCVLARAVKMMMGVEDTDADEDDIEVIEMPEEEENVSDDLFEEMAKAEESSEEEEDVVEDDSDEEEEEEDADMRY